MHPNGREGASSHLSLWNPCACCEALGREDELRRCQIQGAAVATGITSRSCRQAGRQADRQTNRQAGRQSGR
eukprot:4097955-Pleurochrysis_carterae.AAC.2